MGASKVTIGFIALATGILLTSCGGGSDADSTTAPSTTEIPVVSVEDTEPATTGAVETTVPATPTAFAVPTLATTIALRGCYVLDGSDIAGEIDCAELHDGQVFRPGVVLEGVDPAEPDPSVWEAAAAKACGVDFITFTGIDPTLTDPTYSLGVILEDGDGTSPVVSCVAVHADGTQWAGTAESISGTYLGIEVGDCFDFPTPEANALELPCSEPHEAEMFVLDAPIGDDDPSSPYPTDEQWDAISTVLCDAAYLAYTGYDASDPDSPLSYTYLMPLEVDWSDVEGRLLSCAVVNYDGTRLVGSIRI